MSVRAVGEKNGEAESGLGPLSVRRSVSEAQDAIAQTGGQSEAMRRKERRASAESRRDSGAAGSSASPYSVEGIQTHRRASLITRLSNPMPTSVLEGAKSITVVPGRDGVEHVDVTELERARHIHVGSNSSLPDAIIVAKDKSDLNQMPNAAIQRIASIPRERIVINGRSMDTGEDEYEPGQPGKNLLAIYSGDAVVMERGTHHTDKFSMPIHRAEPKVDAHENYSAIQPGMPAKYCCVIF